MRLPGIKEQCRGADRTRKVIDEARLNILGCEGDADDLLDALYSSALDEVIDELMKSWAMKKAVNR